MVVMSGILHNHLLAGEGVRTRRGDFARPRIGTWGSDSGCSDISAASVDGSGAEVATTSATTTRSTVKRRCSTPDTVVRSKSTHRPTSSQAQADDMDGEEESNDILNGRMHGGLEELSMPLTKSYPHRLVGLELIIMRQPEGHHRARYQKEGSRGCIKDRTGNSCPALQLKGIINPGILQIFVATESGKIRPHPLYRACRVGGKRCTPARDHVIENINVLELEILPENNGIINIDCLGILKLRNADLEMNSESEEGGKRRKREPKVRLVFRAVTKAINGNTAALQVVSTPICCTPSPGMPEIHRVSHTECPAPGGLEVVIIGRNFLKEDSKFFVAERNDDGETLWEREIQLQQDHFHHVHVVGTIPPFRDLFITKAVEVFLLVKNKQKMSETYAFKYIPDESVIRTMTSSGGKALSEKKSVGVRTLRREPTRPLNPPPRTVVPSPQVASPPPPPPPTTPIQMASPVSPMQGAPPMQGTPSSTLQATWMGGDNTGNVFRYCIQAPGQTQPIYITFPQQLHQGSGGKMVEPTLEMPVVSTSPYDVAHMQHFLNNCTQDGMPQLNCGDYSNGDGMNNRMESDDDLLDQLLKDIMEPQP